MAPAIETEGLTKSYGRARGIIEVDLVVEGGQIFGFLGPNGAGKSTTIRLLLDLIRPTSGKARVFGLDVHRDRLAIDRRTSYVPGELALYSELTGRQLLDYLGNLQGHVDAAFGDMRNHQAVGEPFLTDAAGLIEKIEIVAHGFDVDVFVDKVKCLRAEGVPQQFAVTAGRPHRFIHLR